MYKRVTDVSKITGLPVQHLRRLCRDGVIPHIMVGNRYYIDPTSIEQLVNNI